MDLPTELRILVYEHYETSEIRRNRTTNMLYEFHPESPALLRVSSRITNEARSYILRSEVPTLYERFQGFSPCSGVARLEILLCSCLLAATGLLDHTSDLPTVICPLIRIRFIMCEHTATLRTNLEEFLKSALEKVDRKFQLQILFATPEGWPTRDWRSTLKRIMELESVEWSIRSTP